MEEHYIWSPIDFSPEWLKVSTEKFDNIFPSWEKKRAELKKSPDQYSSFIDQLKRKQAIDTGIIERMYDLKRGVTETFIKEGFVDSYLQHGDTNISHNLLMDFLKDNFSAIDFIFDFVRSDRLLSVSYIKELHALITQHQEYTEAINSLGECVNITLCKGEYKKHPNNPMRDNITFAYCPPLQVESEMDRLVELFNSLEGVHVLIKAAFLHHAFVQIHPFQDGNGRIARLLASFVLIKEGLFPLSIDRDDRVSYIDALEFADNGQYQKLMDVFAANQIVSIERALNWKTESSTAGYTNVFYALEKKLQERHANEERAQSQRILNNMQEIFDIISSEMERYREELSSLYSTAVSTSSRQPRMEESHYYAGQIIEYAKKYDYYANLSLDRCWVRMFITIGDTRKYRVVISLHHYGYDDSTFAIGAVLSNVITDRTVNDGANEYIDVVLGVPPLIVSSDRQVSELRSAVKQQIETFIMATLAYIANEI